MPYPYPPPVFAPVCERKTHFPKRWNVMKQNLNNCTVDFGPSHIRVFTLKHLILIGGIILVCITMRAGWGTSCWGVQRGDTSWPRAAQHSPSNHFPPVLDDTHHLHTLTFRLSLAFTHHLFPRLPPTYQRAGAINAQGRSGVLWDFTQSLWTHWRN